LFFNVEAIGAKTQVPSQYEVPAQLSSIDKDDDAYENIQDINDLGESLAR